MSSKSRIFARPQQAYVLMKTMLHTIAFFWYGISISPLLMKTMLHTIALFLVWNNYFSTFNENHAAYDSLFFGME